MGNEISTPFEGPTEVLDGRDLASIAKYMKSDACKNVFIMNGAGVSTSAGIPDFRSPKTGLYHNLERLNLPYPEAVFEINFFRENPAPFYTLAKELFPGHYRPTPTHSFCKLLHNRGLLRMCYTQNIDTLERLAGLPDEAVVEAHGSFADQHCIECGSWYDGHKLKDQILRGEVAYCYDCGGLVKPDIVFFGESLPAKFHKTIGLLRSADLLIVMGTSLKVHPFATLTQLVPEGCPRVLVNLDPAGDIGTRPDDVLLLGKSDDVVRDLCKELGEEWIDELDALWKETAQYGPSPEQLVAAVEKEEVEKLEEAGKPEEAAALEKKAEEEAKAARVEAEVEKLAEQIAKALEIRTVPKEAADAAEALAAETKAAEVEVEKKPAEEGKAVDSTLTAVEASTAKLAADVTRDPKEPDSVEKTGSDNEQKPAEASSTEKVEEKPVEGKL